MNLTLPTDSDERKNIPMLSGVLRYFPAALAGVARVSKAGNDKHNSGEPLHHARGKSMDHADCILRHMMDVQDLLAALDDCTDPKSLEARTVLAEASQLAWRALALSQELHERFGAPLAPGARLPVDETPVPFRVTGPGVYVDRSGGLHTVTRVVAPDDTVYRVFDADENSWTIDGHVWANNFMHPADLVGRA